MSKYLQMLVLVLSLGALALGQVGRPLSSGREIKVRTDDAITLNVANAGQRHTGTVSQDVADSSGSVVIPRGSRAELSIVRGEGEKEAVLHLRSVVPNGQRYLVPAQPS